MSQIKPGDIVRCLDDSNCRGMRTGLTYLVIDVDATCVILHGREGSRYKKERFEHADCRTRIAGYQPQAGDLPPPPPPTTEQKKPAEICLPVTTAGWLKLIAAGVKFRFRSGCDVRFVAFEAKAKPYCQLVLLNPATGNIVTRYANGKASEEPYNEPGDIIIAE